MVGVNDLKKKGLPLTITLRRSPSASLRDVNTNLFFSILATTWESKLDTKKILLGAYSYSIH